MLTATEFQKNLGAQIKSRRKAKGLSQVNAAREIGVDYRHYQNIEGGKINLRLDTLLLMMEFYSIKFEELDSAPTVEQAGV